MRKLLLSVSLLLASGLIMAQPKVYYVDFEGNQNPTKPLKEFSQAPVDEKQMEKVQIKVFPDVEYQTIAGIGGCFNEIGGIALMSLDATSREKVMSNLFSSNVLGFSMCRTAVGASDFGASAYSYSEVADDFEMKHFSVDRELKSVIPYIKMAYKYNPEMKLFASPWSPPAWMKYSNSMDKGNTMPSKNVLKKDPKVLTAYAKYFRKYVETYAKHGITVDRLLVQNETDIHTKYPSNVITASEMYDFVSGYLRPEFKKGKVKTEIWAGTFRAARTDVHAVEFVSNEKWLESVDGIGIQYTPAQVISDINTLRGDKPLMHTECICYNSKNTLQQAYSRLGEVAAYINYGSENFAYWNMILNQTSKSGWGWAQNSMIIIDEQTKEVRYTPDYYAMALISKGLPKGAVRIGASPSNEMMTVKYQGKTHVLVRNSSDKTKIYLIRQGDDNKTVARAYVPAKSLTLIEY